MTILSIDTSDAFTYAALGRADGSLAVCNSPVHAASHNEELGCTVARLLSDACAAARDLSAVLIGLGPGSFTGLRIGAAYAEGLACSLSIPVYGVSSFAAKAYQSWKESGCSVCAVASDARRGELFFSVFELPSLSERLPTQIREASACSDYAAAQGASSILREGEIHTAKGLFSLFCDKQEVFRRWDAASGASLTLEYIRPVSARTIQERAQKAS